MRTAGQYGWTLIELMIALAIVAIVLGVALSTVNGAVSAARSSEARTMLIASLTKARGTATFRERDVRICPSSDGTSCLDSYHWESGWIVYVDMNNNNAKDGPDLALDRQGRLGKGVRLVTSSGRRSLEFQPNGANSGSNVTFTFCDARGPTRATAIAMGNAGTFRAVPPSASAVAEACYP